MFDHFVEVVSCFWMMYFLVLFCWKDLRFDGLIWCINKEEKGFVKLLHFEDCEVVEMEKLIIFIAMFL